MKTEAEARKVWCPWARVNVPVNVPIGGGISHDLGTAAVNRFIRNSQGAEMAACIASECMAWRWLDKIYEGDTSKCSGKGYCGLAGKP